jgi:multidrug transporter EmrE-like cation transporter
MKYTDGFSRLWPSVWTVTLMIARIVGLKPFTRDGH